MSGLFTHFVNQVIQGAINLSTVNVKAVLVDLDAVTGGLSLTVDQFLSDIDAGRTATSGNLANKTFTNGVFNADDISLGSPAAGTQDEALVIYNDTPAGEGAKHLIAMWEAEGGLPLTTNGQEITTIWNATGLFTFSNPRLYVKAAEDILQGAVNLAGNLSWVVVDAADYPGRDDNADKFLSAIPSGARVHVSSTFTGTVSGRQLQVAQQTLPTVSGDQSELLVLIRNTGDPSTSHLIARYEGLGGLPITPNGNNILVNACNLNF